MHVSGIILCMRHISLGEEEAAAGNARSKNSSAENLQITHGKRPKEHQLDWETEQRQHNNRGEEVDEKILQNRWVRSIFSYAPHYRPHQQHK